MSSLRLFLLGYCPAENVYDILLGCCPHKIISDNMIRRRELDLFNANKMAPDQTCNISVDLSTYCL